VPQCKPFDSVTDVLGWTHYVIQYSESIGLHWSVSKLFSSATACVVQIATDLVLDMYHCIKNLLFIGHMITDDHKMQMTWRGQACTYLQQSVTTTASRKLSRFPWLIMNWTTLASKSSVVLLPSYYFERLSVLKEDTWSTAWKRIQFLTDGVSWLPVHLLRRQNNLQLRRIQRRVVPCTSIRWHHHKQTTKCGCL